MSKSHTTRKGPLRQRRGFYKGREEGNRHMRPRSGGEHRAKSLSPKVEIEGGTAGNQSRGNTD